MSHDVLPDLRIRRTEKFLQEAMIELVIEKGFDAITVGDIAERAMINRATFYRHYQDKYDLVEKIFEETINHLLLNMKPIDKKTGQYDVENPPEIWIQIFEHFAEYARLYKAMLGKNGSSWFAAKIREQTVRIMLDQEKRWKQESAPAQSIDHAIAPELAAMQLAHVLIGTIAWWLEGDMSATPRQVSAWFYRFAFFGYLSALGYNTSTPWK